ncbi:hypothetical protein [Sphingomonas sp. CROZ-RG-20F-R02-07]|uniref:hypothetical protein n=1 Tax=Sphingomonas sp. CROZ-RG-20F-R02-07 TaxID=2914832 RepID=UPI001F58245B|nr:hypothetical protein [Sphingomonas sp. CROZ-RG-20F-R02-07]
MADSYTATAAEIRSMSLETFALQAEDIVNSAPVVGIYGAREWEELHEASQQWIAGIVRETTARATAASVTLDSTKTGGQG